MENPRDARSVVHAVIYLGDTDKSALGVGQGKPRHTDGKLADESAQNTSLSERVTTSQKTGFNQAYQRSTDNIDAPNISSINKLIDPKEYQPHAEVDYSITHEELQKRLGGYEVLMELPQAQRERLEKLAYDGSITDRDIAAALLHTRNTHSVA